jgi:hypothetical protein
MVNHRLGVHPRYAGHAQSILWHVTAAMLTHTLAARFLTPGGALVAGLTFAVNPVGTEATVSIGWLLWFTIALTPTLHLIPLRVGLEAAARSPCAVTPASPGFLTWWRGR